MLTSVTYEIFCERVKRRLAAGWPNIKFNVTDNEILLYLYEDAATVIVQMSNGGLSIDGIRTIPEGAVTTYSYTGVQIGYDPNSGLHSINLPGPPVNLPLGYSINDPYLVASGQRSYPLIAVSSYQRGYYDKIPMPSYGILYWAEGSVMYMDARGKDLIGATLKVPMLSSRSASGQMTDPINMPDDAMERVFNMVIERLTPRAVAPRDKVNDGNMELSQQP